MDEWERALRKTFQSHAEPIEAAPQLATTARTRSRALRTRQMVAVAAVVPLVLAAAGYGVAAALPGGGSRAVVPASPTKPSKGIAWFDSVGCGAWSTPKVKIRGAAVASGALPPYGQFLANQKFLASAYFRQLESRYGPLNKIALDFQIDGAAPTPESDRWFVAGTSKKIVMSVVVQVSNDKRTWSATPVEKTGCFTRPAPTAASEPAWAVPTLPHCAPTGHAATSLAVRAVTGLGGERLTPACLYAPAGQPLQLSITDDAFAGGTGKPIPLAHLSLYRASDVPRLAAYGDNTEAMVARIPTVMSGQRTVDIHALQPGRYVIWGLASGRLTMLTVR